MMWMRAGLLIACLALAGQAEAAVRTTLHSAAQATENGTHATVDDKGAAGVTVTGTFTGTLTFEGSADGGTTWTSLTCVTLSTLATTSTTTGTGQFLCPVAGLSHFRARISAYTNGSITAVATVSNATIGGGAAGGFTFDAAGNLIVTKGTYDSGEAPEATGGGSANGVMVTEERYLLSDFVTSDTQIKGSAGYVKDVVCIGNDAAATAGSIKLEDALTATTPVVLTIPIAAVAMTTSVYTFPVQRVFATGIFLDFTTTADVACYVRHR